MRRTRCVPGSAGALPVVCLALLLLTACAGPEQLDTAVEEVVAAGPGRGSTDYAPLGAARADRLADAVHRVLAGGAAGTLPRGTSLRDTVDSADRPVVALAEDLDRHPVRGWGLYAVRQGAGAPARLVVEVPHPRADRRTEVLGTEVFTALRASALLVAGAHRTAGGGSADVAHEPASAFAAVDRAVVGPGTVVVQLHGFDDGAHAGRAQVVLSSTTATPSPVVLDLAAGFRSAGVAACVYDGRQCASLAGTRNTQASHARAVGAVFVHLELAAPLRVDPAGRRQVVQVLRDVLSR